MGGHWLSSPHGAAIRDGRYAALRAVAADIMATAGRVVLVAPFTAELRGEAEWDALRAAVGEPRVVHLSGDDELLAARRAARGERRDRHRVPEAVRAPCVPVISIEAGLPTEQQLFRVLVALGLVDG
ncbi:hypothetical protein [Actinoplanes sp. NPDC049265]|uniref:hypothetical protein n=1 Tax=Actinoplanes sp. NPDC049265 TaxID=3363902 RepID=UPI003710A0F3